MIRSSLCGYVRIHRLLCTDRSLQLWLIFLDDSIKSSLVSVCLFLCRPCFHCILRAHKSHEKMSGKSTITGWHISRIICGAYAFLIHTVLCDVVDGKSVLDDLNFCFEFWNYRFRFSPPEATLFEWNIFRVFSGPAGQFWVVSQNRHRFIYFTFF
jgi:hypothetical protein